MSLFKRPGKNKKQETNPASEASSVETPSSELSQIKEQLRKIQDHLGFLEKKLDLLVNKSQERRDFSRNRHNNFQRRDFRGDRSNFRQGGHSSSGSGENSRQGNFGSGQGQGQWRHRGNNDRRPFFKRDRGGDQQQHHS